MPTTDSNRGSWPWRPGMAGLVLLLWAADVAPSHGQASRCPWEDGESFGSAFTNRIELAYVPRSGALDPNAMSARRARRVHQGGEVAIDD